jgi:hypothetical protein
VSSSTRRWDTDTRGVGVGDASVALPAVERLATAMTTDGWVAEEPEAHLLPQLEAGAATVGVTMNRTASSNGAFEIELARDGRTGAEMRMVTLALVSTIAEASTHVRQSAEAEFEVVTGMLPGDSPVFAPHGHVLRFRFV